METIIMPDKLIYDLESRMIAKQQQLMRSLFTHEITALLVEVMRYHNYHLVKKENGI
jgi:hypothetical protein